jgi:hypothetical protein
MKEIHPVTGRGIKLIYSIPTLLEFTGVGTNKLLLVSLRLASLLALLGLADIFLLLFLHLL